MIDEEVESEAHVPSVIMLVLCAGAVLVIGSMLGLVLFGLHLISLL